MGEGPGISRVRLLPGPLCLTDEATEAMCDGAGAAHTERGETHLSSAVTEHHASGTRQVQSTVFLGISRLQSWKLVQSRPEQPGNDGTLAWSCNPAPSFKSCLFFFLTVQVEANFVLTFQV